MNQPSQRAAWLPSLNSLERACITGLVATIFVAVAFRHVPWLRSLAKL